MGPLAILFLLASLATTTVTSVPVDQTMVEDAAGADVVSHVQRKIDRSAIFRDDKNFLRRIAYVETKFGQAAGAYPPNYHGGIWRLDEDKYEATKSISLSAYHAQIAQSFRIIWAATTWRDLRKPLYSGLATRLYLASRFPADSIPPFLRQQADWWELNYNANFLWDARYFMREVEDLESDPTCDGLLDLVIVMDGSGSIGSSNFNRAKNFSASLVNTFSLETTRIGYVLYSTNVETVFPLNNTMNMTRMLATIDAMRYPGGNTNTGGGMLRAVDIFASVSLRPGVPKLMAVFTDGHSNEGPPVQTAANAALRANLTSFAIGIGSDIYEPELMIIANGNRDYVFMTTGYEELAEFFKRFNQQVCDEPQQPGFEEVVEDTLREGEKRYFKWGLPEEGLTIRVQELVGGTRGYSSYMEPNPSSAFYDGMLDNRETFIPRLGEEEDPNGDYRQIFVAVEGTEGQNRYSIEAEAGYHVSAGSRQLPFYSMALSLFLVMVTILN